MQRLQELESREKMRQEKERIRDRTPYVAWTLALALFGTSAGRVQATGGQDLAHGELRIEGTHIAKLFLHGGDDPHSEQLNDPGGSASLPVGTYRLQRIELQGGYVCWAGELVGLDPIVIREDTPAALKVGGPLQQEIKAACRGHTLVLRHALLGIGGEKYRPAARDKPPRFTIFRDGKTVASGQFEYG